MITQDLKEHVIEKVRAAGRVDQIYPDRERPGIVRIEVDGRSYVMTIAEDFEDETFVEA